MAYTLFWSVNMFAISIWAYRIKYYWFKLPIIWYRGTNNGLLVVTGKPDLSKPLL